MKYRVSAIEKRELENLERMVKIEVGMNAADGYSVKSIQYEVIQGFVSNKPDTVNPKYTCLILFEKERGNE
ncbi:MAG: hypothetical protein ACRDDH_11755 [Cetobacterium sp.]|uniref:hypothetical protein n=1 Tax=Cetobacterium sp. TaxID=2071632 RepID=UPI003EE515EE